MWDFQGRAALSERFEILHRFTSSVRYRYLFFLATHTSEPPGESFFDASTGTVHRMLLSASAAVVTLFSLML
jgi:hypothetical protein